MCCVSYIHNHWYTEARTIIHQDPKGIQVYGWQLQLLAIFIGDGPWHCPIYRKNVKVYKSWNILKHSVSKSKNSAWFAQTREVQHVFSNSLLSVMVILTWFWHGLQDLQATINGTNPPTVVANFHRNCQRKCSKQRHLTVLAAYWSDLRPMKIHNHQ